MRQGYVDGLFGHLPGPGLDVTIRHGSGGNRFTIPALLDTGASACAIPKALAERAGWLPCARKKIVTPTGSTDVWVYQVVFEAASREWKTIAVECVLSYAIVGRDVMNQIKLLLDGPNLEFEITS